MESRTMSLLTWGSLTLWLPLQGYGVLLTFIGVLPTPPTPPTAFSMSHLPFKSRPYFETKNIEKKKSTSKCALCQEMWKCNRWNSGTAHCDRWDASALSPPPGHLGPSDKPQDPTQFLLVLFQLWDAWPLWTHQGSSKAQTLKHIFL